MPDDSLNETCPRCGARFECRAASSVPCDCMSLTLSRSTLDVLAEKYSSCLCLSCLREMEGEREKMRMT